MQEEEYESLHSDIHAGTKIATKYGEGFIKGVLGTRIWFTLNNSETGELKSQ